MRHVIIGAGAAGLTAAKTIRALRPSDEVVVISKDETPTSRCLLHKYINNERDEAALSFVPDDFFQANRITWYRGVEITGVNTSDKTVLCNQHKLSYDKLLIAAGAVSADIPVAALKTAKNIFRLRYLSEAKAIREAALNARRVVVIGAGLVGLDVAYALLDLKKEVSVAEMEPNLLPLNLDERAAASYQTLFESAGCTFHYGHKVTCAYTNSDGNVTQLILDNGTILPCDFVVLTTGARPAVGFLKDSGIDAGKTVSIAVDKYMATNCADVFAAGDVTGLSGIWPNAKQQGVIAAKNMCGIREAYTNSFSAKNTVNFYGLVTLSLGTLKPLPGDKVEIREDYRNYRKIILRDGRVVGLIMQGDISNSGFWLHLIKHGIKIDNVKKPIWKISFADFCALDGNGEYFYRSRD